MQKGMPCSLFFSKIDEEDEVEDAWTKWITEFFADFLFMRKRDSLNSVA
jgi:hypothetical protein